MPKVAVLIAVLIAVGLSVAAYFTLRTPTSVPVAGRLVTEIDPARVESVVVTQADGRTIELRTGKGGVEWLVSELKSGAGPGSSEGGSSMVWPAAATRVRAAIRLLCELKTESSKEDLIATGARVTRVRLSGAGASAEVEIAESSVAGRTSIVRRGVGSSSAEANFAQAFAMSDLSLWREPLVFSLSPLEWSRLEIAGLDSALTVSRVGRAWALQKPIVSAADSASVEKAIKTLSTMQASRFEDKPNPDLAKTFESPAAVLTAEFERREQVGKKLVRSAVVQELRVGSAADVGGTSVLCQASAWARDLETGAVAPLWGPAVVVVDAGGLAGLASDPASYASRVSLRVPIADVFQVTLANGQAAASNEGVPARGYMRGADAWKPASSATIGAEDARGLREFLSLVSDTAATKVSLKAAEAWTLNGPASWRAGFKSSEGVVVQELTVGVARNASGEKPVGLVTFDGVVFRLYEGKQVPALLAWLTGEERK